MAASTTKSYHMNSVRIQRTCSTANSVAGRQGHHAHAVVEERNGSSGALVIVDFALALSRSGCYKKSSVKLIGINHLRLN